MLGESLIILEEMRIAWIMMIHKNPEQVNRLISCLTTDGDDVFIHCDKKCYQIVDQIVFKDGVSVLSFEESHNVVWGDYSQIRAIISLINQVLLSPNYYDYIILLSGQCFPIRPIKELKKLLSNEHGEYIDILGCNIVERLGFQKRNALKYPRLIRNNNMLTNFLRKSLIVISGGRNKTNRFFKKEMPIECYYGSSWWALSVGCLKAIKTIVDGDPSVCDSFSDSLCPDESFFQSIFMQTSYAANCKGSLWYIDWSQQRNNPKILSMLDYERIANSQKYFARKFDSNVDSEIIISLEKRVLHDS